MSKQPGTSQEELRMPVGIQHEKYCGDIQSSSDSLLKRPICITLANKDKSNYQINMEIFCFFLGIFYAYTCNSFLFLVLIAVFFITPKYPIIFLFVIGLLVAWTHQWFISPKGMPDVPVIPQVLLQGTIVSIPIQSKNKTQFLLAIEKMDKRPAQGLIQLNWYNKPPLLHAGQHWQLKAKIKKARNFHNPGSYNYVNSLNTRHIYWTGYINSRDNKMLSEPNSFWNLLILREYLSQALIKLAPNQQTAGIVEALTLNLTAQISQEDWSLFRRTGTTHLFGISGEHVALIAGLCTLIIRWLWTRSLLCCLWAPAHSVASVGGFVIALLYAFLAGFAPPVQRALIGNFFYTLYCLGKQRFSPWQIWRYAFFGVLCFEPHAVFMQGFYFSFLAVVCLLLTKQRWRLNGYKGTLALQLSCLIGLMPLTLFWFSYGSLNGFIANLFAIPLIGLFIVPLSLITLLVCPYDWSWILMKPLSWLIALLFKGLSWTEYLAGINFDWPLNNVVFVLLLMGALLLWIVLPVRPFKHLALLWIVIPLFPSHRLLQPGEAVIQILDVGQGLAVSVRTQNHVLLYDTGDQFFQGSDLGALVILPFYQAVGIKKIDTIVISHPDKDHRGGLKSIESGIPVNQLLVNNIRYYDHGLNCHNYPEWQWDGVTFHFFPIRTSFHDKNNNSCILQISTATSRALLTGDIEQLGEDYLTRTYGEQLNSQILIVPHHGSRTSSSYRFLLDVAPRYAIASLGFDNRFHFPHTQTLNRMDALGIPFIRTDECGMVEVLLPATKELAKPQCYNKQG